MLLSDFVMAAKGMQAVLSTLASLYLMSVVSSGLNLWLESKQRWFLMIAQHLSTGHISKELLLVVVQHMQAGQSS